MSWRARLYNNNAPRAWVYNLTFVLYNIQNARHIVDTQRIIEFT